MSFQSASSAAMLLDIIHQTANTASNRILVLWDIDDTLLATHSTLGPRRRQLFTNEDMETLFQPTINHNCVVDNILLSQGTVMDAIESPSSFLYAPAIETGLSYPSTTPVLKTVVKVVPTITSTCNSHQATTYLSVTRGGPIASSFVGISLTNLGRASPPSPNVAHLDSSYLSKVDIAVSFANNGSWDKVIFVDNSLLELGVAQPGPPRKLYVEAPLEDFENVDIQEMFTGRLLQLQLLQTHYAGTAFDSVVSRLLCVHFRLPSSHLEPPVHHKIFPGEFGCDDARYAYFIKQFRLFCEYIAAKGEPIQLMKNTQIISLGDNETKNYPDAISTELKRIVKLINTFRVAHLETIIVHCAESDGVDNATTRQTLKSSAADLHRQLSTSRHCNPPKIYPLLQSLHTLVFDTAGGETIPSDSIFELNGLCLTYVESTSNLIDFSYDKVNEGDVAAKEAAEEQQQSNKQSVPSLPDWSMMVRVWRPEEGSSAFFVHLSNGSKYVIKGSMNIASELFANLLMCAVGIRVPQCRLVAWPSDEWDALKLCIKTTLEEDPSQHATLRFAHRVMNRSVLLVQEYIEAAPTSSISTIIGGERASCSSAADLASLSASLGMITAADAILNNSDRFPIGTLWNNDGNIGNIIISHCADVGSTVDSNNSSPVTSHPLRFIPIDNQFVPLGEPYFADYTKKLKELRCSAPEILEKVALHMHEQFGTALNSEILKQSFYESCNEIQNTLSSADDLIKTIKSLVELDWENYWRGNVMSIAQHTSKLLISAQAVNGRDTTCQKGPLYWESIYRFWKLPPLSQAHPVEIIKVCIAASPSCNVQSLANALHAFALSSPYSPLPSLVLFAEGTTAQSDISQMVTLSKAYPGVFMVLGSYGVLHQEGIVVQRCVTVRNGSQLHVYDKQFLGSGVARVKGGHYDYCIKEPLLSTSSFSENNNSPISVNVDLATVICRDVEDREVMGSLLAARRGPLVVASPIKLGGTKSTLQDCSVAICMGTRKLEPVAAASCTSAPSLHLPVHFIRADVKFPVGLGNSQIVTPHFTIENGDPQAEHIFYHLPLALSSTSKNSNPFSSSRHVFRSLPSDDIGKRITVRTSTPLIQNEIDQQQVELRWLCGSNAIVAVDKETSLAVSDAINLREMVPIPSIKGSTICNGYVVSIESGFVFVRKLAQNMSLITAASIQLAQPSPAKTMKMMSVKIEQAPSHLSISGFIETEDRTLRFGMISTVLPPNTDTTQTSEHKSNDKSFGNITAGLSNGIRGHTLLLSKNFKTNKKHKILALPTLFYQGPICASNPEPPIWAISENRLVISNKTHVALYEVQEGRSPSSWDTACF